MDVANQSGGRWFAHFLESSLIFWVKMYFIHILILFQRGCIRWAFVGASVSKMKKIFPLADPILKILPIIHPGNKEKFKSADVIKLGIALGLSGEIISNLENEW